MKNNKVVYIHRKVTSGEIFYVGMGNPSRPYHMAKSERSKFWHRVVKKYGHKVEVIRTGLTKRQAFDIEMDLIELIGRRDKGLGTLVNLSNGGDGANGNGTDCYNIETGRIYLSIGEASKDIGIKPTSLVDMMSEKINTPNKSPIRRFDNPYTEDRLPKEIEYIEEINGYDSEYKGVPEFDDRETDLLDRINSLPEDTIKMLEMSYSMGVREIASELNLNYMYIHRKLKKAREVILGDDIHLYKNKSLKHQR